MRFRLPPRRRPQPPLARPPTSRRVRRLKLVTALSLMAALSLALVLFAFIVSIGADRIVDQRVGQRLEERIDVGVEHVRASLEREDAGGRGATSVDLADNPYLTSSFPQLYVVDADGRVMVRPTAPLWPDVDVTSPGRQALAQDPPQAVDVLTEARRTPRAGSGDEVQELRVLAVPVVDADGEAVAVVGVADSGSAAQDQLASIIRWAAAALLAVALLVAVLLARGRFWLVDRAIADHEQFLRDTAHELRAPIATLAAITDSGLSGQERPERALELAAGVLHQTDEVIDDLVALARIEVGRDELQARRLRLDLLVEALISQRKDDPPAVLTASPTIVRAQPSLVRRAVGNLIDNAMRHGRVDDPLADVVVSVADGAVTVTDHGPGVSPGLLSRFTTRSRNRRRTRARAGGTGLGLATAQWVATIHGGELDVSNRRNGVGASFTLRLPQAEAG